MSIDSGVVNNLVFPIQNDPYNQTFCVICREDFQKAEQITKLACSHIYHSACFLQTIENCPTCRIPIPGRKILPEINCALYLISRISAGVMLLQLGINPNLNPIQIREVTQRLIQEFRNAHVAPQNIGLYRLSVNPIAFNSITIMTVLDLFSLEAAFDSPNSPQNCLQIARGFFQDPNISAIIHAHDEMARAEFRPLFENCEDREILQKLRDMGWSRRSMMIFFIQGSNHALDVRVMRLNEIIENERKAKCANKFLKILSVVVCTVSVIWAGVAFNRQ